MLRNQTKYKSKTKSSYALYGGAEGLKKELIENGPVEAVFTVYEDFMTYESGVYHHVTGKKLGEHAVKVVGYGNVSNSSGGDNATVPYWIAANSWNKVGAFFNVAFAGLNTYGRFFGSQTWGESGFFRIKMGDCGFDFAMTAAMPLLHASSSYLL